MSQILTNGEPAPGYTFHRVLALEPLYGDILAIPPVKPVRELRAPLPEYTHELHALACRLAAIAGTVLQNQHVLCKRGQIIYCATLQQAYTSPNGLECWTVNTIWPEKARLTIAVRNVVACHPASCSCLFSEAAAAGSDAGACGPASASEAVTCL